jgi:YidC/Oxa1 family membrane protein insertase
VPRSLRNQPSSEDQRNVIIATILMAAVLFVWMYWVGPTPAEQAGMASDTVQTEQAAPPAASGDTSESPTAAQNQRTENQDTPNQDAGPADAAARSAPPPDDAVTARAAQGTARPIVVETDLYTAVLSTKGATLKRFTLKDYLQFDQQSPVQLVDTTGQGALALAFTTTSSRFVDTRSLHFTPSTDADTIRVTDREATITFEASLGDGTLRQTYTFEPNSYDVGLAVQQMNAASYSAGDGYELVWDGGLPFSEGGTQTEMQNTGVFAYSGGEMEGIRLSSEDHEELSLNGDISWLAVKNKYFTATMLPDAPDRARGADLIGDKESRSGDTAAFKSLTARLQMPAPSSQQHTDQFHLYLGPLDYYNLTSYERDLYAMVDYGWDFFEWMTRPFATLFFIPALTYAGGYLPYGVVVILMAVFIKTVVYPLTKSSYRSMAQMRELQPQMQEIKDKYGDDPQKQQEEMMKLYRETGVNPLGGCLPMLLQYPIIIALYQYIPQSIQLRQKSFLWAADLSAPDKILQLPFEIPFYGDYVAGFTLLMGLSMIVTMRMQSTPGQAGGQAKVFMYMMPAVIFFIFNQFASALSLYYLFYNVVTAAQQKWINYQLEKEKDAEDGASGQRGNGRGTPKDATNGESKGFFQRLMERAEEAQKQQ